LDLNLIGDPAPDDPFVPLIPRFMVESRQAAHTQYEDELENEDGIESSAENESSDEDEDEDVMDEV
jgi:hypothetical protein